MALDGGGCSAYSRPMNETFERERGGYCVTTDAARMDVDAVHAYLVRAYWCEGIPRATVERAVANSLCFAVLHGPALVGFARVVTDSATFAYLCDVYILEEHRGRGYASVMLAAELDRARDAGCELAYLFSDIRPQFYATFGFVELPSRNLTLRADALPAQRVRPAQLAPADWNGVRRCFEQPSEFGLRPLPGADVTGDG